jgi:hypothetical protein
MYGTQRFFTLLTKARHWILSQVSRIQFSASIPISLRSVLMLPSYLRLGLPSGLLPLGLPKTNTSPLLHACHMSRPPHPPWFNHPNNIRWRIQVTKFIVMQFSPWFVFHPFRFTYPPQHPVLKNPQSMFLPRSERSSFAPIQHNWQNYSFVYFNL